MGIKRPLWSFFIPQTPTSRLRGVAVAAPTLLFGIAATSIVLKQSYYRNTLQDEEQATHDRIDRRAYVALPDGRMALVYPVINADFTPAGILRAVQDSLSLLP